MGNHRQSRWLLPKTSERHHPRLGPAGAQAEHAAERTWTSALDALATARGAPKPKQFFAAGERFGGVLSFTKPKGGPSKRDTPIYIYIYICISILGKWSPWVNGHLICSPETSQLGGFRVAFSSHQYSLRTTDNFSHLVDIYYLLLVSPNGHAM